MQWDRTLRTASEEHERAALWAGRLAAAHALRATDKKFYVCDATVPRQPAPELMARSRQIGARHGLVVTIVGARRRWKRTATFAAVTARGVGAR